MRISTLPKLWQSTRVRIGVPMALGFTWVGIVSDGFTYWSWLSTNWAWVVNLVRSPYFYWAFAVCILALIASGIRSVAKAEIATGEQNAAAEDSRQQALIEVQERTAREHRDALRLPMKMAAAEFFLRELRLFDQVADQLRSQIEEYADHIKRWSADEPFDLHASESPKNPIHFLSALGNVPPICSFQVPLRQGIAWQDAMVVRTPKEAAPPMERWGTYEPGKNRELQLALAANVKQARSIYSEWISARDVANAALDRLQREIREELSQYVRLQ